MDAIGIGRTGLAATMLRMQAAAANIANARASASGEGAGGKGASVEGMALRVAARPLAGGGVSARIVPQAAASAVDPASELVALAAARQAAEANLKLIGVAARMARSAVDLWA